MSKKKHRLKVKRAIPIKRKKRFSYWDYLIFIIGGIAAVAVAVWGGYYMGRQSEESELSPAIQTIINHVEDLRARKKYKVAEEIIDVTIKEHPDSEELLYHKARVLMSEGKPSLADTIIHNDIKDEKLRKKVLLELRDAYRIKRMKDDSIRISKEIAHFDEQKTDSGKTSKGTASQ